MLRTEEHQYLECKTADGKVPNSVWETYSAFANTEGGLILLGVAETDAAPPRKFQITGVKKATKMVRDLWNTVNTPTKVSRNVLSGRDIGVTPIDGSDIIWIQVPPVPYRDRPVYRGTNPLTGTYKRNSEGDYHCTEEEVRAMLRDSQPDAEPVLRKEYTLDDLDPASVEAYRVQFRATRAGHTWANLPDKDFLRMLHACVEDSAAGQPKLTAAGLLMFGKGIHVSTEFPGLKLDYFDKSQLAPGTRWRDRLTYDGTWEYNLYNYVFSVLPRLMQGLAQPFQMDGIVRVDDTPVHKAVREAVINTIVHCDFHLTGSLSVTKDDHGFHFRNPGPPLIPISDIYAGGETVTRNRWLQTMFRMIGYGEGAGSGFPLILEVWRKQGWRLPDISENRSLHATDLRLWTLPSASADLERAASQAVPGYDALSYQEKAVVMTLIAETSATTERFTYVLGRARSETQAFLTALKDRSIIRLDPAERWVLEPNGGRTARQGAGANRTTDSKQSIQALLARRPQMSTHQIAEAIGQSERSVQRAMRELLDTGSVRRTRTGNAVTYSLTETHLEAKL
ncbi:MAG: AAA family ATPase [Clostridia bacterium]|nr:AAA family ATPase [Clostridia bacterium]